MCPLHTVSTPKLGSVLFIITTEIILNTIYLIVYKQFYYYQELLDFRRDEGNPQDVSTAVFYSISATERYCSVYICTYV